MALTALRTVWFNLSKALGDSQRWVVESFPAIIQRATGYSEQWALMGHTTDNDSGTRTWQYQVEGLPEIDIVVDHIIHELTDAVLINEQHTVTDDFFTFGSMQRDKPEPPCVPSPHEEHPPPSPSHDPLQQRAMGAPGERGVEVRKLYLALAIGAIVLAVTPVWAQEQVQPSPQRSAEAALAAVATHLSPPHALYLYESLTRQVLSNEQILEQPQSSRRPLANDSLWALGIISKSILVDGQDGQYMDVRLVPSFFKDVARRYMNVSHYWPDRDITPETRREHLAAWYSLYLMLLVGNTTQDEIAAVLRNGAFEREPGMLEAGGPSLVDKLKRENVLTGEAYKLVHIRRGGPAGREVLIFPAYMDQWKEKIYAAYGVK